MSLHGCGPTIWGWGDRILQTHVLSLVRLLSFSEKSVKSVWFTWKLSPNCEIQVPRCFWASREVEWYQQVVKISCSALGSKGFDVRRQPQPHPQCQWVRWWRWCIPGTINNYIPYIHASLDVWYTNQHSLCFGTIKQKLPTHMQLTFNYERVTLKTKIFTMV